MSIFVVNDTQKRKHIVEAGTQAEALGKVAGGVSVRNPVKHDIEQYWADKEYDKKQAAGNEV